MFSCPGATRAHVGGDGVESPLSVDVTAKPRDAAQKSVRGSSTPVTQPPPPAPRRRPVHLDGRGSMMVVRTVSAGYCCVVLEGGCVGADVSSRVVCV